REHAKNRHRIRTIPMHAEAVWAVTRLIERARSLGAVSPHHHLMPFRVSPSLWDLDRPMSNSGIRKQLLGNDPHPRCLAPRRNAPAKAEGSPLQAQGIPADAFDSGE